MSGLVVGWAMGFSAGMALIAWGRRLWLASREARVARLQAQRAEEEAADTARTVAEASRVVAAERKLAAERARSDARSAARALLREWAGGLPRFGPAIEDGYDVTGPAALHAALRWGVLLARAAPGVIFLGPERASSDGARGLEWEKAEAPLPAQIERHRALRDAMAALPPVPGLHPTLWPLLFGRDMPIRGEAHWGVGVIVAVDRAAVGDEPLWLLFAVDENPPWHRRVVPEMDAVLAAMPAEAPTAVPSPPAAP